MSLTGIEIPPTVPGSPAWLSKMSASKVAAVLGLSPYDSRFSLYFRMHGDVDPEPQTNEMARGHYLEPAVARWFIDQHKDWQLEPGGCWQHRDFDWYTASPDRLVRIGDETCGVELKTDDNDDRWGTPGTDEIPVHVRAQCMSQMDVLGTRKTYVAMLSAYLEFREYVVTYDEAEADFIRDECWRFMDDLANHARPNIDEHTATYLTLRKLHPDISPLDVELEHQLTVDYCTARHQLKAAEANAQLHTNLVADAVGSARRGRYLEQTIVTRQSRKDGTPYLVVGRKLPHFDLETAR